MSVRALKNPEPKVAAEKKVTPQAHGSDAAPVLFFDGAVAVGLIGPIAQIELAVTCRIPVTIDGKPEVRSRVMIVGHLRGSLDAMAQLADSIEKALTMGQLPLPVKVEEKSDV